jgi:hypothetical protein
MADVTLVLKASNTDYINKVKEAQTATQKLYDTASTGGKREKGILEEIDATLVKLQKARQKAFTYEDIEKYNKKIAETKQNLQEYEQAGLKAEKTQQSLAQSIGKWALGLGLAATAMKVFKDVILATTVGLNAFNIVGAATKQILNDIITTGSISMQKISSAIAIQKEFNKLRIEGYIEATKVAQLERNYQENYAKALDQTLSTADKLKAIDDALASHNSAVDLQIDHTTKALNLTLASWKDNPLSEKLMAEAYRLKAELENLEASRVSETKRLISKRSGIIQQAAEDEIKWRKDLHDNLQKNADDEIALNKETQQKISDERHKQDIIANEEGQSFIDAEIARMNNESEEKNKLKQQEADADWAFQLEIGKKLYNQLDKEGKEKWDLLKQQDEAELDLAQATAEAKFNLAVSVANLLAGLAGKNKSLLIAGLIAEKAVAIADVIIQTKKANAAMTAWGAFYAIPTAGASIIAAQAVNVKNTVAAGLSIAAIVAATIAGISGIGKYAKGGWTGSGSQRDETGERVAGVVHEREFVIRKGPAHRFRDVLEAINRDDKKAIFNSFNKLSPDLLGGTTVNNVVVENEGPNKRLDRVNEQLRQLNKNREQVFELNGKTVYRKGNTTRVIR